ncbi:hypothetical protein NA57DRAFT_56574 [Rhizodiscina lignyota]|uniref:Uncharacterized protein n=1 Tax=Rhizodiscina lignyota TaxID=1504668 RepID=A0A9P4IGN1_9PEZI|nr:hypothetical protein NA57DRAFT_56574 [Rhizodiscina lignyota]
MCYPDIAELPAYSKEASPEKPQQRPLIFKELSKAQKIGYIVGLILCVPGMPGIVMMHVIDRRRVRKTREMAREKGMDVELMSSTIGSEKTGKLQHLVTAMADGAMNSNG